MERPFPPGDTILARLRELHLRMLAGLRAPLLRAAAQDPAQVAELMEVRGGDAIYRIDEKGEEILLRYCAEWSREGPFLLVAEGLGETGERMFPEDADPASARFRLIVDPIDGTRGLMYDKRSAWILAAVAPEWGPETSLRDLRWAVMTEVPTTRARYADQLWAERGGGARGVTYDLVSEPYAEAGAARIAPSRATELRHGFAGLAKYFPGGKELTARLEEALFHALLGPPADGTPQVFDDQYISTGGQFYELITGHDRFTADLRPLILPRTCAGEAASRLCAHPYDVCTELIAREAGVILTAPDGGPLDALLRVHHDVGWVGYANEGLRRQIEPVLQRLMREMGLL